MKVIVTFSGGNAIVPQLAYEIFKAIIQNE
jgi:hypothetical protein